ncbi:hypothetical protein [Streptomyces sulphureus]|uniref:hypothetical protein n=1 Tax=Streptomyces sulphureus TaxID=47758 RepID=UPI000365B4C9|nr:hypothetical protein [Streptomyces sulphureus]
MATERLGFQALDTLKLGKLKKAVDAWADMRTKLGDIAEGGEGATAAQLERMTAGADWSGANAQITQKFTKQTAEQVRKMAEQAESVRVVLSGAHSALKRHKKNLQNEIEDAAKKDVLVLSDGSVNPVNPSAQNPDAKPPTQGTIDGVKERIDTILEEAGHDNAVARRGLEKLAKDPYSFADISYKSFEDADAEQGVKDAEDAADLMRRKDKLTGPQLAQLEELLERQHNNPAFAEKLATEMGPEGVLQFWRSVADPGQGDTPTGARSDALGRVQDQLSLTLATASHVDTPAMEEWKKNFIDAGSKQFGHPDIMAKGWGFQYASALMGKGKFDSDFLDQYGDALTKFEKEKTKGAIDPAGLWANPANGDPVINHSGKDPMTDPMTGFLKATSHNPEFASELFGDEQTAKYLLKDREYYPEDSPHSPDNSELKERASVNALGDALFAGGSGVNPDEKGAEFTTPDSGQKRVLHNALSVLGEQNDEMAPELRDDMAKLLVTHGDDTYETVSEQNPTGGSPLDHEDLAQVTKQISRTPEAHALLQEGMGLQIMKDMDGIEDMSKQAQDGSLRKAGTVLGYLEEARYQALETDKDDPAWTARMAYHGIGSVVGEIPVVGDVAQRGVDALTEQWRMHEEAEIEQAQEEEIKENNNVRKLKTQDLFEYWNDKTGRHDPDDNSKEDGLTEYDEEGHHLDGVDVGQKNFRTATGKTP